MAKRGNKTFTKSGFMTMLKSGKIYRKKRSKKDAKGFFKFLFWLLVLAFIALVWEASK